MKDRQPQGKGKAPEKTSEPARVPKGTSEPNNNERVSVGDPMETPPDGMADQHLAQVPQQTENRLLETSSDLSVPLVESVRNRYNEDKFFELILVNPGEFTNFLVEDGLVFFISEGAKTIAIPDIKAGGWNIRELITSQAHSILTHLGDKKTATYMRDQVWWKSMVADISAYCKSCQTCVVSKPQPGKPQGRLKTMPVPRYSWQCVGVDFVSPLLELLNRTGSYDMICVVIDQLTSMVHIVPARQTYRATDVAKLIFKSVISYMEYPSE